MIDPIQDLHQCPKCNKWKIKKMFHWDGSCQTFCRTCRTEEKEKLGETSIKLKRIESTCLKCDRKYKSKFKYGLCEICKRSEAYRFNYHEYNTID